MYQVTDTILDPGAVAASLAGAENAGSVVIHCAIVRERTGQDVTTSVTYVALPGAEDELREIGEELKARWGVTAMALVRRTGTLAPGDMISIAGAVAPHREEAFAACEEAVTRIRNMKHVQKHEAFEGRS